MKKLTKIMLSSLTLGGLSAMLFGCGVYGADKYTVKFVTNGGSAVDEIKVDWGTALQLPTNPTKTGYSFAGWYTDEYLTAALAEGIKVDEDLTLYAKWTINQYTVTFDVNGTTYQTLTQDYKTKTAVDDPTLEGYTFAGWYTDEALTKSYDNLIPGKNTKVYSKWQVNRTSITFDKNAENAKGTMDNQSMLYTDADKALKVNAYTNSGYNFKGWSTTPNGEVAYADQATFSFTENGTVTLYAIWEAKEFAVQFVSDGTEFSAYEGTYLADIVYPTTNPTKTGYTFKGWGTYTETADTEFADSKIYFTKEGEVYNALTGAKAEGVTYYELTEYEGKVPQNGIKLFAIYERNKYNLTFEANGGSEVATINNFYGKAVEAPANPTKLGHTFKGWYTKADFTSTPYVFSTIPAEDITLYAKWEKNSYTVDFNTNGGSAVNSQVVEYGTEVTLPTELTKVGYTLAGWYTDEALTQAVEGKLTVGAENVSLYAKWTANSDTAYTVEHYIAALDGQSYTLESKEDKTGTTDTNTAAAYKELTGFTGKDATITQITIAADGSSIVKLYYDRNTYTVTFTNSEDNSTIASVDVLYEGNVGTIPTELVKTGYSYTLSDSFTASTEVTNNVTITVTYTARSSSVAFYNYPEAENTFEQTVDYNYGDEVTLPTPTKTGYKFDGWYSESTFDNKVDTVFTMGENPVDVYAKWTVNQYTITFNTNEGSSVAAISGDYDSAFTMPEDPTKTGYTFKGWYADSELSKPFSASKIPSSDVTVYAKWEINQYTFAYVVDGKTTSEKLNYGENTPSLSDPTKTGYTFAGWYTDKDLSAEYTPVATMSADVTVYAKWNINQYTITFKVGDVTYETFTRNYDTTYVVPANPTKNMDDNYVYVFAGWKLNDEVQSLNAGATETIGASDLEYVASFNQYSYSIRFLNANGGSVIYSTPNEAGKTPEQLFAAYIADLYAKKAAYNQIHTAINEAIGGNQTNIGLGIAYFSTLKGVTDAGYISTLKTETELSILALQVTNTFISKFGMESVVAQSYAETFVNLFKCINYVDEKEYCDAVIAFASAQEALTTNTSARLNNYSALVSQYEANAYNPYRNDGKVFDGWGYYADTTDLTNVTKSYYAKWVEKAETPTNLSVPSISKSSITISWDEVEGAWGYKVIYSIDGVAQDVEEVRENKAIISGLSDNSVVKFSVVAISSDEAGERRNTSTAYSATQVGTSETLNAPVISLDSDASVEFTYVHVVSGVGDVEVGQKGDYYYVDKNDPTQLYIFANTSYEFANVSSIEITEGSQFAKYENGKLVIGNASGSIKFTINYSNGNPSKNMKAYINQLVSSIELGDSLSAYESTVSKIGTDNSDYLSTEMEHFYIGKAQTSLGFTTDYEATIDEVKYSNGFKFDVEIATTSGSYLDSSTFKLDYKFYNSTDNGASWNEVTDTSALFVYDEENDVFFFLENSGLYKVVATYKADSASFTNVALPNAYKTKTIEKSFVFELNSGINVFTDTSLKAAYANNNVKAINLENNIEAKLDANQVGYLPYLQANGKYNEASYTGGIGGELDIAPGTAVFANSSFGPKVWKKVSSKPASEFYLTDKAGNYYVYDANDGNLALIDCEWVENYGAGHFKICNSGLSGSQSYINIGLKTASIYTRRTSVNDVVINGNYFTIDGSNLPSVTSEGSVSLSGFDATYHIQHCVIGIFESGNEATSTFRNLSVVSNTQDSSAYLNGNSGDQQTISQFMERTSGGYNAFKLTPLTDGGSQTYPKSTDNTMCLENVNISNSLIAVYVNDLATVKVNNSHIKQTWANSMFAYRGGSIEFTNSKVETSGGASFHIDECYYTMDTLGYATNSEMYLDFLSLDQSNYVSGEEQWFKAYSMEVMALGMKSQIENGLSAAGYTILNTEADPVTGLVSEKMNFVYLSKNENIGDQTGKDVSDLFPDLDFDKCSKDTKLATGVFSKPVSAEYSLSFDLYQKSTGEQYLYCADTVISSGNTVIIKIPYVNGAAVMEETVMYSLTVTPISATQKMITYTPLDATMSPVVSKQLNYFYMEYSLGAYSLQILLEAKPKA